MTGVTSGWVKFIILYICTSLRGKVEKIPLTFILLNLRPLKFGSSLYCRVCLPLQGRPKIPGGCGVWARFSSSALFISILKCELYNLLNLSTFLKIFKILKNYTISLQKYSSFLYHYHRFILTPSLKSL